MSMGKPTAVTYIVQVTAHLAECARASAKMSEEDILSHFLNSLDASRFREVLTIVITRRSVYQEDYADVSRLRDFLNRDREDGGTKGFDYYKRTVILEQVMAQCVQSRRASSAFTYSHCTNNSCQHCVYSGLSLLWKD